MNRNYSNVDKKYYVHEHHAYDKNNAGYLNVGALHNKSGVIVCGKCTKSLSKQFLSENENLSKRKRSKFFIVLGDFLYKV